MLRPEVLAVNPGPLSVLQAPRPPPQSSEFLFISDRGKEEQLERSGVSAEASSVLSVLQAEQKQPQLGFDNTNDAC